MVLKKVGEDQRPFALEQVTADLFSVLAPISGEIEDVVLNLEGRAEIVTKSIEVIEILVQSG